MSHNNPVRRSTVRLAAIIMAASASMTLAACNSSESPAPAPMPSEPSTPTVSDGLTGEWASLQSFVDKYPEQSLLIDNSIITGPLQNLLGSKYETFKTNMKVQSPLTREGSVLYTSGNKPHEGGTDAAYLLIDTATKTLEVGLWENGKLTTYPAGGTTITKPKDIQTIISNSSS